MYSTSLQGQIVQISEYAGVIPGEVSLLNQITGAFIRVFAKAIGAEVESPGSLLEASLHLSLLSDALAKSEPSELFDRFHYLVGMGFEQTGALLARFNAEIEREVGYSTPPLENDDWYRMLLAFLHYLAGGHRVQALSVLRTMEKIKSSLGDGEHILLYESSIRALWLLYRGQTPYRDRHTYWESLLFGPMDRELSHQENRIKLLARQVQQRRDIILGDLGQGNEGEWLARRDILGLAAEVFWRDYLFGLANRGITTFTREQVGPGFDEWLRVERDLLVILPTGSGKTIVGELRSALALAQGRQVLWLLPTRALVRQTQRELFGAFHKQGVVVEELPVTEDFTPLFADDGFSQQRYIAATTPEKLAALLRANPEAVAQVGLVVLDEAQILSEVRGTNAEFVLLKLKQLVPDCHIVLMTAFADTQFALERLLEKFSDNVARLISEIRPTRRIYGVITDELRPQRRPIAMLYPPGIQTEDGYTETPICLHFPNTTLPKQASQIEMAKRVVQLTHSVGVRTVLFVQQKLWTESNARDIARRTEARAMLPVGDLTRLQLELERPSAIEEDGACGVSPHHAGLSILEQHLVEKWLHDGVIKTVVATPTLAQGVNLPFDLSIVSFRTRFNSRLGANEELSNVEILNMLGRAGRAGYVSDGVCLLTDFSRERSTRQTLDDSRRYFFRPIQQMTGYLGLSRLLSLVDEGISDPAWLSDLGELTFHEAQGLISFALDATAGVEADYVESIMQRIREFPSTSQMAVDQIVHIASILANLVGNIHAYTENAQLIEALVKTGMPLEVLDFYLTEVQSEEYSQAREQDSSIPWADTVVLKSLQLCQARNWYQRLIGDMKLRRMNLECMFASITLWRNGTPMSQIERTWVLNQREVDNRIKVGEFFNHDISVFTQFWGALAVCESLIYKDFPEWLDRSILQKLPTYTREGVSTDLEHDWLRVIGGMDRVVAHRLAEIIAPDNVEGRERRQYLRSRLREWKYFPQNLVIPDDRLRHAILSVADEVIRD
ncbi:MAG: ski2-like helicase [Chloroflexi bacterium ADurb.Bin360]|nr:MAG: ski2-like helicase [Chloroflexi bacterium ADurb.Bin360]